VQNVSGLAAGGSSLEAPRNMPVQALDYVAGYLAALGALVGLARRATEGGSWHVRVSLVQVAHWLAELGTVDAGAGAEDLPEAEVAALSQETPSAFGRLRHLRPAVGLSETPAFYARPPEPLGSSPPAWP